MKTNRIKFASFVSQMVLPALIMLPLSVMTIALGWPTADSGMWPDHPDRAIWMDAAWRIVNGQVPHLDFITPIGSAWLSVNALPVWLFGPEYSALPYGTAIIMLISGLIIYHILRPTAGRFYAILGLLYVHKIFFHAQFLDYNEIALFILTLAFVTSVSVGPERGGTMGAYCGASLAILLFWKINFFVAAPSLIGIAILAYPRATRWYMGFGVAIVAVLIICGAAIDFRFDLMLQQYSIPAAIKGHRVTLEALSLRQQSVVTYHFILYVAACAAVFWLGGRFKPQSRFAWTSNNKFLVALFLLLLGIQNAMCLTNANVWAPHMVPWVIFMAAMWAAAAKSEEPPPNCVIARQKPQMQYISAAVTLTLWASTAIPLLTAIPHMLEIETTKLNMNDKSYAVSVADGVRLLQGRGLGHMSIFTLSYANPFPAILKSPPPKNAPLWWNIYDSINVKNPPIPQIVMADVNVVMEPVWHLDLFGKTQAEYMEQLLGEYVEKNYTLVAQDRFWKVWLKRSETAQVSVKG
jgi:hypothetical protein